MTHEEWKIHQLLDRIEEVQYYVECCVADLLNGEKCTELSKEQLKEIQLSINSLREDVMKKI